MIDISFFHKVKDFETNSWAVWDEEQLNDVDFFFLNLGYFMEE